VEEAKAFVIAHREVLGEKATRFSDYNYCLS
jgi:hypothetical protein